MNPGTVFVASDFILDERLAVVAAELERRGYRIVRGPVQKPPAKTVFAAADHPRFFGATDVILTSTRSLIPPSVLDAAPRLRAVVFPTVGTETIDIAEANARGIAIANGPTPENFESMAEATVLLILAQLYDLHHTERVLRECLPRPKTQRARMLRGKTVGLIGLGRIARGVVQRLAGWHVNLFACDPYVAPGAAPAGVRMVALDELLRESDVVSVHTTLTSETRHMIGARELALMRPTAFFINTARGGMVDEQALYAALAGGKLAGAALDAFELEPLPLESPLRTLPNVILTPHMIGHTREIFEAIPGAAIENIERLMRGEPPLYWRNPEVEPRWRERLARLERTLES